MKNRLNKRICILLCLVLACLPLFSLAENEALTEQPQVEDVLQSEEASSEPASEQIEVNELAEEGAHVHEWIKGETVKPTCKADGYTIYTCKCGASKQDDIVATTGHDWKPIAITLPSCDGVGFTEYKCKICNETKCDDEVAALGHDWTEWVVEQESTCEIQGKETRHCRECGKIETNDLPYGHEWDEHNVCKKCHKAAVAKVGGVMFVSLQSAIESAKDATVELMADGTCELLENKPVKIDKKGFQLVVNVPKGCTLMQEGNVYVALKAYAEVNGESYTSLAAAVAAAKPGDTVKVLADETGKTVKIDKNLTIDFNKLTYTAKDPGGEKEPTEKSSGSVIELEKDVEVVLKNGTIAGKGNAKYLIQNNSKQLTLQDMTLDATLNNQLVYALSNNYGVVFLNGNTNISGGVGQWAIDLWKNDSAGVQVILADDMVGKVAGYVRISDGCNVYMDEKKYGLVWQGEDEGSGFPYYCIGIVKPTPTPRPTATPTPTPTATPTPKPTATPTPTPSPTATNSSSGGGGSSGSGSSGGVNSSSAAEGDLNATEAPAAEKNLKYYSYQAMRAAADALSGGVFGK